MIALSGAIGIGQRRVFLRSGLAVSLASACFLSFRGQAAVRLDHGRTMRRGKGEVERKCEGEDDWHRWIEIQTKLSRKKVPRTSPATNFRACSCSAAADTWCMCVQCTFEPMCDFIFHTTPKTMGQCL